MTFTTNLILEEKCSLEEGRIECVIHPSTMNNEDSDAYRNGINGGSRFPYKQLMIYLLVVLFMIVMGWAGLMYVGLAPTYNIRRCDKINVEPSQVNDEFLKTLPPDPSQSMPDNPMANTESHRIDPKEDFEENPEPIMSATSIVHKDEAESEGKSMTFKDLLYSIPHDSKSIQDIKGEALESTTTITSMRDVDRFTEAYMKMKMERAKETTTEAEFQRFGIISENLPETTKSAVDVFKSMGIYPIQHIWEKANDNVRQTNEVTTESEFHALEFDDEIVEAKAVPSDWKYGLHMTFSDEDSYEDSIDSIERSYPLHSHQDKTSSTEDNSGIPDLKRLPILRFGRSAHYSSSTKLAEDTNEDVDSSDETEEPNDNETSSTQKIKPSVMSADGLGPEREVCRGSLSQSHEKIGEIAKQLITGDDNDPMIVRLRRSLQNYIIRVFWRMVVVDSSEEWSILGEDGTEAVNVQHLLSALRMDFARSAPSDYWKNIVARNPPTQELSQQFRNVIESLITDYAGCMKMLEEIRQKTETHERSQNKRVVRSLSDDDQKNIARIQYRCQFVNCGFINFPLLNYSLYMGNRSMKSKDPLSSTQEAKQPIESVPKINTDNQHRTTTTSFKINSKSDSSESVYAPPKTSGGLDEDSDY